MEDRADRQDAAGTVLEFRLPDLGEGLADAELVSWAVAVGDMVQLNQTIAEVETAKAVVELPCPFAGRVVELMAGPGDTVPVGAPLIRVEQEQAEHAQAEHAQAGQTQAAQAQAEVPAAERRSVLVGYGPEEEVASRRRNSRHVAAQSPSAEEEVPAEPVRRDFGTPRAAATPGARKLARELGIDLWYVAGSGPGGAVTVDDVRGAVPVSQPRPSRQAEPVAGGVTRPTEREVRTPVSGVRKRMAAAMVSSGRVPQAAASITVDCTASMELLDHLRGSASFTGLTLTPLALVAKAVLAALAEFPGMNAAWDEAAQEIVTKHYVNLGIAVATERGLLVPNIKDAQTLSLRDLTREIGWLVDTARSGTAAPADLRGGTFTITNIGVFGVDSGTPLVNPGEAAILCLGAIAKRPWVFRDELAVRWVTTLGAAFDHRLVDGELAARFLSVTAGLLEDPLALLSRV